MNPESISIALLALAVFGHAGAYLFKSPKEVNGELSTALRAVTSDHELLARRFERHDEAVKNLTTAVERLTARIDKFEPFLSPPRQGRRGPSGRD